MSRNPRTDVRAYPRSARSSRGRRGVAGFTMLELLISLLIVLLGVLGLAGLIVRSNQAEMESYQRVQALMLAQDMADRINANRKVAACYSNGGTGTQLGTAGGGYTGTPVCDAALVPLPSPPPTPQQQARVAADMAAWNSLLTGSAEVLSGSNVGAMIGARGCVNQIDTQTYRVSVVWQGLAATAASSNTCANAAGLYGTANLRRVVTVTIRIATLS